MDTFCQSQLLTFIVCMEKQADLDSHWRDEIDNVSTFKVIQNSEDVNVS